MPIAGAAQEFCTRVPQFVIGARGDGLFGQDFKEARPPAAAFVPTIGCFFIAEAITPNGDGYNDEWIVGGLEYFPAAEGRVFNRWGQQVFYSQGYQERWDGRYNNAPLPMADYYFVIEFAGDKDPITGTVTLKY